MSHQLNPHEELLYSVHLGVQEFLMSGILDHINLSYEESQEFAKQTVELFKTSFPHRWEELVQSCQKNNN